MKMTSSQSKFIILMQQLERKSNQYNNLSKELDRLHAEKVDQNSQQYIDLLHKFKQNNEEIKKIVKQLKSLDQET